MRDNERFIVDLNKKRETAWQQLYEEFYPALCTYVAKLTHENVGVEISVVQTFESIRNRNERLDFRNFFQKSP